MRRALCTLMVALASMGAVPDPPQQAPSRAELAVLDREGFVLQQNFPNPFNPETEIPFILSEDLFEEGARAVVTVRIYNVLASYVATPVATDHPAGPNVPVDQLEFTRPGQHVLYWDGKDRSGREVASGIYVMQLTVNGHAPQSKKILVAK